MTGWLIIGGVAALVVCVTVLTLASPFPERAPDIADPRACSGSNVELQAITAAFDIELPPDVAELRFHSDVHPTFGEHTLRISFRTTPAGLRTLLAASRFAMPSTAAQQKLPVPDTCPGPESFRRPLMTEDQTPAGGSRTLVVDTFDPAHPLVYIHAVDS
ncbi:hypothetical protein ACWEOO_14825 [Kribbella sp. NPDC004138]